MAARHLTAVDIERQQQFSEENRQILGDGKKYHILTFGCQLNDNDSEKMAGILAQSGMMVTDSPADADLVLINTCSVRENADGRFFGNLGMIRNMQKDKPEMLIGVCGCMMTQEHHVTKLRESYPFVDLIFGTSDIYRLPELLNRRLKGSRRVYDVSNEDIIDESIPLIRERKHRALVTIMYGCNNFCTYCIVPYTRGRERSRAPQAILEELQTLAEEGYGEVMLLGQNVNTYGKDLEGNGVEDHISFAELLERAATTSGLKRIRFMTSHPKDISNELIDVIAKHENIERHIHLPVQSGSNEVLRRMNRKYTRERYLEMVDYAKAQIPGVQFSTDIIVGFPGETDEDHADTLSLLEAVRYQSAFTFQYSPREGTPAAKLETIDADTMKERFQSLLDVQNRISLEIATEQVGTTMELLVEGLSDHQPDRFTGRSSSNFLVNFSMTPDVLAEAGLADWGDLTPDALGGKLEGSFIEVRITEARTFSLTGEAVRITSIRNEAD